MILCFELSMPNNNSWNGKWSGEGNYYAVVRNIGRSKVAKEQGEAILKSGYFHYSFGDGWAAGVSVREVTSAEARKIHRKSSGFCGYDWMIDSIVKNNKIIV